MAKETNIPADGAQNDASWVGLLRYHKSFTAKLLMSELAVREYYAEIASELLSYHRVRSRTGWAGITFSAGRAQLARCTVNGKTLCLYLATDPAELAEGRYKARDAAAVRRYEKTPALLFIRSAGSAKNAVARIAELAKELGLVKKDPPPEPIMAEDFPQDSFENLIARGLIRVMKRKTEEEAPEEPPAGECDTVDTPEAREKDAYTDTVESIRGAISRHAVYGSICEAIDAGDAAVKLSRKKMLRAVDEDWVSRVENSLLALDELIRSPSHYISETEEVLPMELTKKITGRSVVHLCQHTDYIASVNGNEITPSKILNVFREDSVLTYENKFLNTLLAHLYYFVTTRYRIALSQGADEQVDEVQFENHFFDGEKRGRIKVSVELCERLPDTENAKKGFLGSGLWKRVEHLNGVVQAYMESDFVRQLGRNYVQPPILRTNAILKNKYLRECLDLWNFLEGYDESGVGLTVEETVCEPSVDYLCELSENAATQYLVFRHHTGGTEENPALVEYKTPELHPNVRVREDEDVTDDDEFDVTVEAPDRPEDGERDILFAVRVALQAAELYVPPAGEQSGSDVGETVDDRSESDEDDGSVTLGGEILEKDFQAKIRLADGNCRAYFLEIANALLSLRRVKMRISRSCCTFTAGRTKLAKITVKGKTLYFYTALEKDTLPAGFFARDASDVKKYEATPTLLRVRGPRALKNALSAVARIAERFGLQAAPAPLLLTEDDFAPMTVAEMTELGWIRRRNSAGLPQEEPDDEAPKDDQSTEKTEEGADAVSGEGTDGTAEDATDETLHLHGIELMPFEYNTRHNDPRQTEHEADYFEHSSADPDNYGQPGGPSGTGARGGNEHLLSDIRYPGEMDYTRPTGKGVDDSSGFIQDSRENSGELPAAQLEKRSLLDRLFGKKNERSKK